MSAGMSPPTPSHLDLLAAMICLSSHLPSYLPLDFLPLCSHHLFSFGKGSVWVLPSQLAPKDSWSNTSL